MKVLVISDTHRRIKRVESLIAYYNRIGGIDAIIHCGDHIDDARALQNEYPSIPLYMVPGNCDREGYESNSSLFVEIGEVPTLITHGHKHHVKYDYEELCIDGEAYGAKLVLFGHTHSAFKEKKGDMLLLNPGSLSEPRDTTYPSFAILDIENKELKNATIFNLIGIDRVLRHPYF